MKNNTNTHTRKRERNGEKRSQWWLFSLVPIRAYKTAAEYTQNTEKRNLAGQILQKKPARPNTAPFLRALKTFLSKYQTIPVLFPFFPLSRTRNSLPLRPQKKTKKKKGRKNTIPTESCLVVLTFFLRYFVQSAALPFPRESLSHQPRISTFAHWWPDCLHFAPTRRTFSHSITVAKTVWKIWTEFRVWSFSRSTSFFECWLGFSSSCAFVCAVRTLYRSWVCIVFVTSGRGSDFQASLRR